MHDVAVNHKDVVESEEVREELEIAYQVPLTIFLPSAHYLLPPVHPLPLCLLV